VESLRCPTCLGLLPDSDVARCPACHTRFRKGARPISLGGHNGMSGRAHPLLERELEARLEAKTAAGFRQRRRAAKIARRIAALPPTLFESGGGLGDEPDQPAARRPDGDSIIIDLPDTAIHETTAVAPVVDVPVEPTVEPVVEVVEVVAPVEPTVEPVVEVVAPVEVVEPVVEPVAPVEPVVEVAQPVASTGWQPSTSLWKERVFNSVPLRAQTERVTWPRQWKPVPPITEVDAEPIEELAADTAN
jgi:hypothetical protein